MKKDSIPWPVVLLAFASAAVSGFLSHHLFGRIPHIADEVSYVFQARIFSSGHLWLQPSPVPEAFAVDHIVIANNHWCSIYPPGWPMLLAAGSIFRIEWLINPLLLFFAVLGVWRLACALYDKPTAAIAVAFFCASPFVLLMSSGFMSHLSTLCALVWCYALLLPGPVRMRSLFLAGVLAGVAFLIRPFTAVALLAPVLIWVIWNHRQQWKSVPGLILAGAVPSLIVFFLYNRLVFGNMFQSGYPFDPQFEVAGLGIGVFVHNFFWYWRNLNDCLWGFPWPDLFTLIFLALPAKSSRKYDWLLLASTACLVIAYCFYSYTDIVYSGPRYVFEGVFLIAILAARSLLALWKILRSQLRVSVGVGIAAFATILFFPLLVRFPQQVRFHAQNYHGQVPPLISQLEEHGVSRNALIFVGGDPYIYRTFFLLNALNPAEGDRVFVRDIGSHREEIRRLYPRQEEWRLLVELRPIPGPNSYADRWSVVNARWEKR